MIELRNDEVEYKGNDSKDNEQGNYNTQRPTELVYDLVLTLGEDQALDGCHDEIRNIGHAESQDKGHDDVRSSAQDAKDFFKVDHHKGCHHEYENLHDKG